MEGVPNPVGIELSSFTLSDPEPLPDEERPPSGNIFEIEDVEENVPFSPSRDTGPSSTDTFGQITAEAVPSTMYYRSTGHEANKRPTLETLRMGGYPSQIMKEEMIDGGESNPVSNSDGEELSEPKRKWWQCCKVCRRGKKDKKPPKLGWIQGVLIRCMLNIWGVMLFIRLSWVVGQSGILLASVVVILSAVVTTITTLSMSAICTNGEVKGGGAYYLISRSLGPEFGGAIGILFSLANAVAVALYVVGFAETVVELMGRHGASITPSGNPAEININDIRIIGLLTVTLLLGIALIGLDWEAKIQIVLLVILVIALIDSFIGSFIPRGCDDSDPSIALRGFTGYSTSTFIANLYPAFELGEDFFTVFAVFFPAATGILAGANLSGDLKDPQTAIPKGTFLAIGITSVVYLLVAWMNGLIMLRNAPGSPKFFGNQLQSLTTATNGTFTCGLGDIVTNMTTGFDDLIYCSDPSYALNISMFSRYVDQCGANTAGLCRNVSCAFGNGTASELTAMCALNDVGASQLAAKTCQFGLLNYYQVMEMVSWIGPIVTAGIFAATLSSALASLVSAPKVFQRVCQDKIFPFIHFFAKGGGRSGTEPIRGYLLTYVIAVAVIAIGELNIIALIISNFFLMAYTLINFSCFASSFSSSPGWRPAFRLYSKWVSLAGSALCLAVMFVIKWWAALITLVAVLALYLIVYWRKPDINWGSSTQAFLYTFSMRNLLKLEKLEDHVKNYRPQFLVLTGAPSSRPDLVLLTSHMATEVGIMVCGQVIMGEYTANRRILLSQQQKQWLRSKKVKAFHNMVTAGTLRDGAQSLLQLSGLGKLHPNTLVIGFKKSWTTSSQEEVDQYVNILQDAFDLQYAVVIFRLRAGFDVTDHVPHRKAEESAQQLEGDGTPPDSRADSVRPLINPTSSSSHSSSPSSMAHGLTEIPLHADSPALPRTERHQLSLRSYQRLTREHEDEEINLDESMRTVNSYSQAMEHGIDDFDEVLPQQPVEEAEPLPSLPEITTMPSRFSMTQEKGFIDVWWLYDDGGLGILLPYILSRHSLWKRCKLRIFTAGSANNIDKARLRMATLLRKFRISFSDVIEINSIGSRPSKDSIDRYLALPLDGNTNDGSDLDQKTLRHIRLNELLREHSIEAKLIVITMSVPQRNSSARQYLSWLEIMSWDLPPMIMMRGNQTNVLTYQS